ncbi:MAG: argC [Pseudobdellovibrio sp.]|nr:argC [Pseudobdellovibrio sp.]
MTISKSQIKKNVGNRITCSIVGARGYSGLELAKLLLRHPHAELKYCFATSEFNLMDYLSSEEAAKVVCLADDKLEANLTDVVFLATPAEVSLKLAPKIVAAGKKVVDLSGAFRLKENSYETWYGFKHTEAAMLQSANYGLLPFAGPAKSEKLIANPGCFATAVAMALVPLLKEGVMSSENIVIDAKSGATGAGKKAAERMLYSEVDGECLPYKVGCHQHQPEIQETVAALTGKTIDPHFVTSLLPVRRGIIAGVYGRLAEGKTADDIEKAFAKAYGDYSLVSFAAVKKNAGLLSLKKVVGTAKTHISYEVQGEKIFVFSCIDNLMKGAASQAVENFNRISDFPLETGINGLEALI